MAHSSSPPAPTRCGWRSPEVTFPHVRYLRTLADSRALVSKALASRRAVVIGASFIGLEVAASLRARNIDVHVVGPETIPMEKVLGPEVGSFIRRLHEDHGVTFHLGTTATSIDERSVTSEEWRKASSRSRRRRHRRATGDLVSGTSGARR